jgi:hypothetical protein
MNNLHLHDDEFSNGNCSTRQSKKTRSSYEGKKKRKTNAVIFVCLYKSRQEIHQKKITKNMILLRKIKSGRRSILWRFNGAAQYIDGPRLVVVWPCLNRLQPLVLHQANDMQYLEIRYTDGRTEIQPGPASAFDDPLKIFSILTKDLITLDANEILISYTQNENENKQGD